MNNVFRWARLVGVLVTLAAFFLGILSNGAEAAQSDEHKLNYFQTSRVKIAGRNAELRKVRQQSRNNQLNRTGGNGKQRKFYGPPQFFLVSLFFGFFFHCSIPSRLSRRKHDFQFRHFRSFSKICRPFCYGLHPEHSKRLYHRRG